MNNLVRIENILVLIASTDKVKVIGLLVYTATAAIIIWILTRMYYKTLLKIFLKLRKRESELREINARLLELEYRTKNITDSLVYARHIQDAMLPAESHLKNNFADSFVFFQPRDIVSGDFYWFGHQNGINIIAGADCTGHGVPGALISMLGHNFLNQIIKNENITQPGFILDRLNDLMKNVFSIDGSQFLRDGMDISICAVDTSKRKLAFAGALSSVYIIADGKLNEIKGDRMFLGAKSSAFSFKTVEMDLTDGASLYMFSDGYADQFGGPENKKFMYRRFKYLLTTINNLPMSQQKLILSDTINKWIGNNNTQIDDILVIGIKI